MPSYNKITSDHEAALSAIVTPDRLSRREVDLTLHARDQSFHHAYPAEIVVWPESTQEVSQILKYANANCIPVTAWGAGTSLEGNPLAVYGGIILDLTRMDKILKVSAEDFQVDVQPGLTRLELNKAMARLGLF